jgi:hypothetical protein
MPGSPYAGRPHGKPHRGATVLTLGILGLAVCCICGIVAWAMGNADLREMAAGRMDRSGEGLTVAGKICGIISVIIVSVIMVIYLFVLIAVFVAHGSSAM